MKTPFYLAFATIAAFFAASASAIELGWTAGPMASDGSTIRTDGTLVGAYAFNSVSVNGVSFSSCRSFPSGDGVVAFSPTISGTHNDYYGNHSLWNDVGTMLHNGWYWNNSISSVTLTLSELTAGNNYLVQLVAHSCKSTELNMAVSVSGTTPQPVGKTDGEANAYKYGASVVGVFTASSTTESFVITYSGSDGERPLNAIQVRDLGAGSGGGGDPVETPVYTLTIPAKTGLVLDSVTTNGVAVAVANNACSIVSNTTVTINFTAASGYEITSGNPVVLTVTGDKTLTEGEYPVVQEQGGGGDEPGPTPDDGWTAVPMGATSSSIRTDGTLKYAYALGNYTANGVTFVGSNGLINNADCVVWENTGGAQSFGSSAPSDTESGGYKNLLENGWWANAKSRPIQLNNLESGKRYLVQIIGFRKNYTTQTATAPGGEQTMKFDGEGWEYGGSLVGVFTASGASAEFSILYVGQACINAIQVRELSSAGPVSSRGLFFICK